jgi:serine/threonine protein kinase/formylglycine-generating enzyme required for sulfatase activity
MDREQLLRAALFDFMAQWSEDRACGVSRPLSEYLDRFPECEEEIAREFLRARSPSDVGEGSLTDPTFVDSTESSSEPARYRTIQEIARGGMGRVVRVSDRKLRREVAMKLNLGHKPRSRARLVEEAYITGALDHPGVVPVHDTGVDAEGRSYFTMRLVEGRDLREIIRMVHGHEEDWTLTRALDVLLKVCDTLAYAHSRGVVHRDLKPSNIRVGSFGEVYVLDWGLAKSEHGEDVSPAADARPDLFDRRAPALTLDGDVIGTPYTMSPEQASGSIHEIGPRSDVYSAGAMLYELLSGTLPFLRPGESATSATILERVRTSSPTALKQLCPKAPLELVAICEKAMARDPEDRYSDMRRMASDLRAYLEMRVVSAHKTGPWAELAKWITRNRWLSVAIGAVLAISTAAAIFAALLQHRNEERLRLVADGRTPRALVDQFEEIHPDGPECVPAMESWLAEARDLLSRRERYRSELESLRERALPWDPDDPREKEAEQERTRRLVDAAKLIGYYRDEEKKLLEKGGLSEEGFTLDEVRQRQNDLEALEKKITALPAERRTWRYAETEAQFRHDLIDALLQEIAPLVGSPSSEGLLSRMERRLEFSRTVEQTTRITPAKAWRAAILSIQDKSECPAYGGLVIRPQLGLIPIRRDPRTRLWEFLHAESGELPSTNADGSYVLEPRTGIVLVLVPGGEFEMGAQTVSRDLPNFDPDAQPSEWTSRVKTPSAVHARLAPFFLSKYELTQAQWLRITGTNPSGFTVEKQPTFPTSGINPVENVPWTACMQSMRQVGLALPTEAQWEFAARAGSTSPWWTGVELASLAGAANIADRQARLLKTVSDPGLGDSLEFDDGFAVHAPVGSLRANAFGLHDVIGNVSEWCRDVGATTYDLSAEVHIDTLERIHGDEGLRVHRGGSFATRASEARSSARAVHGPLRSLFDTGLRPSLDLTL